MRTVLLTGTNILSSRLGFGLSGLHRLARSKDRQRLLASALHNGINYFDAAPYYGHGLGERELGNFSRTHRSQIVIATKFGIEPDPWMYRHPILMRPRLAARAAIHRFTRRQHPRHTPRWDFSSAAAIASVDRSLRSLRTDHLDILYLHDPDSQRLAEPAPLFETLKELRASGKILHFGLAGNLEDCLKISTSAHGVQCLLQVNAARGDAPLEWLNQRGIAYHASYGHFRGKAAPVGTLLAAALAANQQGVILFSTRSIEHLITMVGQLSALAPA